MPHAEVICISGCSSGIGHALAERLAARGATVYAAMRDASAAPPPRGARPLQLDVTRAEEISAAIATIERECGALDVLINNAGINAIGPWEIVPAEVMRRTFDVNFFGAVELTRAVLPLMRRRRRGTIVMISSLSAQVPLPASGVYAASKFALDAFAESLSYEVRRWNIRVAIMSPGGYATELDAKAWRPAATSSGAYAPLLDSLRKGAGAGAGTAEDAADRIIAAMDDDSGRLRYPLDDTGHWVFSTLSEGTESARDAVIRTASGLAWWLEPDEPSPANK